MTIIALPEALVRRVSQRDGAGQGPVSTVPRPLEQRERRLGQHGTSAASGGRRPASHEKPW
jgi:hypothetical protein